MNNFMLCRRSSKLLDVQRQYACVALVAASRLKVIPGPLFPSFCLVLLLLVPITGLAHREIYHVDPVITEHSHMEYEAVIGSSFLKGTDVGGVERNQFQWELEGNLPFTPSLSAEVVLPFGVLTSGDTGLGLGDLEVEPRWVFLERQKFVANFGVPFLFPTGDTAKGLSEDHWAAEPTFRLDYFGQGFDLYLNSILGIGLDQKHWEYIPSVALIPLWRVTNEVTLSPVAELTANLNHDEPDSLSGAAGFGVALREWFALAELQTPFIRGDEPSWQVMLHLGYHKVKGHPAS